MKRFAAASAAGFEGVEYWFPYAHPAEILREQLDRENLKQVLFNLPAGNWEAGERGIACLPGRQDEFKSGVACALKYAQILDCKKINCLAGIAPADVAFSQLEDIFVENIRFAANLFSDAGIKLLVEPINRRDVPGFFLNYTSHAIDLIKRAACENIFIQYDVYHMQIMQGDLSLTVSENLSQIAHMQIADHPGRHEPGTGEINYPFLFSYIDRLGYDGWIGCEYKPTNDTLASLHWCKAFLEKSK